jgi:hypothetical protein
MTGGGTYGYFLLSSVRVPFHPEIRGADMTCSFQLYSRRCRLQVPSVREAVDIECSFRNELVRTQLHVMSRAYLYPIKYTHFVIISIYVDGSSE